AVAVMVVVVVIVLVGVLVVIAVVIMVVVAVLLAVFAIMVVIAVIVPVVVVVAAVIAVAVVPAGAAVKAGAAVRPPARRPTGARAVSLLGAKAVPRSAHAAAPIVPGAALGEAEIVPRPAFLCAQIFPHPALRHAPVVPRPAGLRRSGRRSAGAGGQKKADKGQRCDITVAEHLDPSPFLRSAPKRKSVMPTLQSWPECDVSWKFSARSGSPEATLPC